MATQSKQTDQKKKHESKTNQKAANNLPEKDEQLAQVKGNSSKMDSQAKDSSKKETKEKVRKNRYTREEDERIRKLLDDALPVSAIHQQLVKQGDFNHSLNSLQYRVHRVLTKKKPEEIRYGDE